MSKKQIDFHGDDYMEKIREHDYYALGEAIYNFRYNEKLSHDEYQKLFDNFLDHLIICHDMKLTNAVIDNIKFMMNKKRGFIKTK